MYSLTHQREPPCRQAQALLDFHGQGSGAEAVYERLGNVTSPMLVIAGQQDHVDPVAGDLALLDAVPGAAIVEVMLCSCSEPAPWMRQGHTRTKGRLRLLLLFMLAEAVPVLTCLAAIKAGTCKAATCRSRLATGQLSGSWWSSMGWLVFGICRAR